VSEPRKPSLVDALIPTVGLILMIALAVYLYGDDAAAGPNQFALALFAAIACLVARKNGHDWESMRAAVREGVGIAVPALFILLAVGALIGTWVMSGTVPAMIYYGLQILDLDFFYMTACALSALVAAAIGSSWTLVGTLGIGLMGIAASADLSPAVTAGAVISGAYFGDKSSPLSDATNLAAAASGANLFPHIRHTLWTAVPGLVISLIGFGILDGSHGAVADVQETGAATVALDEIYNLSLWLLTPVLLVGAMAIGGIPPFLAIMSGALFGGVLGVIFQPDLVVTLVADPELPIVLVMIEGVWTALVSGFVIETGDPELDNLLSRGGMDGMLTTVWLILTAMGYGAIVERFGMINRLIEPLVAAARTTGRLVAAVVSTCFGANVLASDQYIAIALPGRVYAAEFRERELAPVNLSRAIGDSATVTSALVPWNTCGAYMAATLGVATFTYLPFAFFNLVTPLLTLVLGFTGLTMLKSAEAATTAGRSA
jgi:NhaC family Na+:H+ antiporter